MTTQLTSQKSTCSFRSAPTADLDGKKLRDWIEYCERRKVLYLKSTTPFSILSFLKTPSKLLTPPSGNNDKLRTNLKTELYPMKHNNCLIKFYKFVERLKILYHVKVTLVINLLEPKIYLFIFST